MSDLQIRPATRADVPEIVRLLADDQLGATREAYGDPLPEQYWSAWERLAADPSELVVVGELDGRIVATAQISVIPSLSRGGSSRATIEAVRVESALRGGGYGTHLIEWLIEEARSRGCAMVQLTSDATRLDAHRFYERLGFARTHVGMKLALT
ncbi:MAG: GNAT family N-acetyltransferase [Propionibacteriaceae bacterium]|nr:GNAT family N-acetyltransferase [Propionibacteriaceae bacterium]